jgi:hypothetical protein
MNKYRLFAVVLAFCLAATAGAATYQEVLGFEVAQDVWVTEADLSEFALEDLRCERVAAGSYSQLRNAAELSTQYVKQGQYSLKWSRLNEFSSLSTVDIDHDWSGLNTITFWAYSTEATNQKIYFVLHSDSTATAWKDFYYKPITVDWQGWKKFVLPFADFNEYETTAGFDKIDSIGFYAKLFNARPNPYTVLYFDDMRILDAPAYDINVDEMIDIVDYSILAQQWNIKLTAEDDFSSAAVGGDISSGGWYGLYGAVTDDVAVVQFDNGKKASAVYGSVGGKYRKNFADNNILTADRYVYISADITPLKYAGQCYEMWAGFWAKFYAGVYVGLTPAFGESSWQASISTTGGNEIYTDGSYPITSGNSYRLKIRMDTQSSTGSMFIKDLTAGDTLYSALPGLQDLDMAFTSSNNPVKWERFYMELSRNGSIDNIILIAGDMTGSALPLGADLNNDREVDFDDLVIFADNWLTTY